MRIAPAALKACMGIVALCWATTGIAASGGTSGSHSTGGKAGSPVPSIRLLPQQQNLAGTCGGNAFDVNTFINVTTQASADVKVSAANVGTIEEFTDETGKNIGPYNNYFPTFQIQAFGGGLPPNTTITISITTYSGPNLTGSASFLSTLVFNCTTGEVLLAQPPDPPSSANVPVFSPLGLVATSALLLFLGALALRRRRRTGARIASK